MPISELTRRDIVDLILLQDRPFYGKVGLVSFLKRIWDLSAMPSTDPRFETAEGDICKHMVLNEDWDANYLLQDYLDLPRAEEETFLRFLETCVHPIAWHPEEDPTSLVKEINAYLDPEGRRLVKVREISGRPVYQVQEHHPLVWEVLDGLPPGPAQPDIPTAPFDPHALSETLIEILMVRGAAREVAVLAFAAECTFSDWEYDNLDGGAYLWTLSLRLPARLYGQFTPEQVDASERAIQEAGSEVFKGVQGHHLPWVKITASVQSSPQIREQALHWLNGEGINNQGRVRSDNIAARQEDGLLFRSLPEIYLYRALKQAGVTLAPLPVFLRGGATYARIEPDFILWRDKVMMVIEVDGDTVHRETPAEADQRLSLFKDEGAFIKRIPASACNTEEKARGCADEVLKLLAKLKNQR